MILDSAQAPLYVQLADLFRQRYSAGVEQLVVVVLVPGSVIWAAAQVRAFGQIMSANSGMSLVAAITLAVGLCMAVTVTAHASEFRAEAQVLPPPRRGGILGFFGF